MDECKWSQIRFKEIKDNLTPFLLKTGYKESDLIFVPISGLTGQNIKEATAHNKWYKGPSLLEVFDQVELEKRFPDG